MFIQISTRGELTLEDTDNFKAFAIVEMKPGQALQALGQIAEPAEADHFWINAEDVIRLSGRADQTDWVDAFWSMLQQVEAYGYSNMSEKKLKAHVESA